MALGLSFNTFSLSESLATKTTDGIDTVSANSWLNIKKFCATIQPDSSLYYATKVLKAQSLPQEVYWKGYILRLKGLRVLNQYNQALLEVDSVFNSGSFPSLSDYFKGLFELEKGRILNDKGTVSEAQMHLNHALLYFEKVSDTALIGLTLEIIAKSYLESGRYSASLEYYQRMILLAEETENDLFLCETYNNIARVYIFIEDLNQAEDYFLKSYNLAKALEKEGIVRSVTNNLGFIAKEKENYDMAIAYFHEAILSMKNNSDTCVISYPYYNLATIYRNQKVYDSAIYYHNISKNILKNCSDTYIRSLSYIEQGILQTELKNFYKAETLLKNAVQLSQKMRLANEYRDGLKALSNLYSEKENMALAYEYYKKYTAVKDSLYNDVKARELEKIENEYDFNKEMEARETTTRLADLKKKKELSNAIWIRNTAIAGVLILLVVIFQYNRFLKQRKRDNEVLQELNYEIKSQKEELAAQSENLIAANEEIRTQNDKLSKMNNEITQLNEGLENKVRARTEELENSNRQLIRYAFFNSHNIRAPLARLLGLTYLATLSNKYEVGEYIGMIDKAAKELDSEIREAGAALSKQLEENEA